MHEPINIAGERPKDWGETLQSIYFRSKSYLKRYWWVMCLTICIGVAYQAYVSSKKPTVYVSQAEMKLAPRFRNPEGEQVIQQNFSNLLANMLDEMQSSIIVKDAHDRVAAMYPEQKVSPVSHKARIKARSTSIFTLTATGRDPRYTQLYLDAVMDAFKSYRSRERTSTAERGITAMNEQLASTEAEMERVANNIVDFQKKNNIIMIQEHGISSGAHLADLKNKLADLKLQQKFLNNLQVEDRLAGGGSQPNDLLSLEVMEISQSYKIAKGRLEEMIVEQQDFSKYLKVKHPKMMKFKRDIVRLTERLAILEERALRQLQGERRTLATRINNLSEAIAEQEVVALDYSRRLAEFDRLKSERDRKNKLYEKLLNQIQALDITRNVNQEFVRIYKSATPAMPSKPNMMQALTKGAGMGSILGVFVIFVLGSLDRRVISTEDLKSNFEEPVLGIIPKEKSFESKDLGFLQNQDKKHIFSEAFRTLRSSLLFMEQTEQRPNTYVITSAVPEEGKSTIASNLAISLALASSRTLLVDADLRRGRLNRLFNLPNKNGLIEVLNGKLSFDDAVIQSDVENLSFLPRGETVAHSAELLLSDDMDQLIKRVKNEYDFVIFDAAPVLATDDTTSFASKVDSILYVVRSSMIRLRQVRVALDNLKMRGATINGFIMNFADTRGMDYYYYNKYQYYYRYYSSTDESTKTG